MIFRLSQKLATKLKIAPKDALPLDPNPLADWTANLFRAERTQFVILTSTASLYTSLMYGRAIGDDSQFIERALDCVREFMSDDGLGFIYQRFIAPASASVSFSKALNRSVTGSMNDLVLHAKMWLTEGDLSPHDTSCKLNQIPLSPIGYRYPREALKELGSDLNPFGTSQG